MTRDTSAVVIRSSDAHSLMDVRDQTIADKAAQGEVLSAERIYGDGSMFVADLKFRRKE